jgi:hypothetical protein
MCGRHRQGLKYGIFLDARHQPVSRIVVRAWGLPLIGTIGIADLEGLAP